MDSTPSLSALAACDDVDVDDGGITDDATDDAATIECSSPTPFVMPSLLSPTCFLADRLEAYAVLADDCDDDRFPEAA